MKKWYEISVKSYEGSTTFLEALTDEEYETVKRIADKVTEEYTCESKPDMSIVYANVVEMDGDSND